MDPIKIAILENEEIDRIDKHKPSYSTKLQGKYKCYICEKLFLTLGGLHQHISSNHKQISYKCDQCTKTFSSKGHLKRHHSNTHSRSKIYRCDYCEKTFSLEEDLQTHIDAFHHVCQLSWRKDNK